MENKHIEDSFSFVDSSEFMLSWTPSGAKSSNENKRKRSKSTQEFLDMFNTPNNQSTVFPDKSVNKSKQKKIKLNKDVSDVLGILAKVKQGNKTKARIKGRNEKDNKKPHQKIKQLHSSKTLVNIKNSKPVKAEVPKKKINLNKPASSTVFNRLTKKDKIKKEYCSDTIKNPPLKPVNKPMDTVIEDVKKENSKSRRALKKEELAYKLRRTSINVDTLIQAKKEFDESKKSKKQHETQLSSFKVKKISKCIQTMSLENSKKKFIEELQKKNDQLKNIIKDKDMKIEEHRVEKESIKMKIEDHKSIIDDKEYLIQAQNNELQLMNSKIHELLEKIKEAENQRAIRNLEVQGLKGNIRTFCRIKPKTRYTNENPFIKREAVKLIKNKKEKRKTSKTRKSAKTQSNYSDYLKVIKQGDRPKMITFIEFDKKGKEKNYFFDRVYTENSTQQEIYNEFAEYIESVYDGNKIVIFAYGQSGSGKTYTLQGNYSNPGILPQALAHLLQQREKHGSLVEMGHLDISVLEIYNDSLNDLLSSGSKDITLSMNKNGRLTFKNLLSKSINTHSDIDDVINISAKNRNVDMTMFNSESSRSHCIYRICVSSKDLDGNIRKGLLNIIDLAGCEKFTDNHPDPVKQAKIQKEAKFINKSLTTLRRILKIKKENRINGTNKLLPSRETKLTRVIQDCIDDEDAVTLMMINICQEDVNFQQTKDTLSFSVINV